MAAPVRLLVLGDSSVGKTSLLKTWITHLGHEQKGSSDVTSSEFGPNESKDTPLMVKLPKALTNASEVWYHMMCRIR